ncbi:MAG: DUF4911 domain-containing protein [Deferribacteraceae bacterium]|jgi:hypothetical protein|nr:DUF4911 domain-containing protein [Deferribacteraceae bacterium]
MTDQAYRVHISVKPSEIIYLNGLIDSYENIGIMRTKDESAGKVTIYSAAGYEDILAGLLKSLIEEGLYMTVNSVDYIDEL